jgi:hypothetical protein
MQTAADNERAFQTSSRVAPQEIYPLIILLSQHFTGAVFYVFLSGSPVLFYKADLLSG